MYCSVNLWEITKTTAKRLFKKCLVYVFGSVGQMDFLIVSYDFSTGNYEHLLLPDGHCAFNDIEIYNTVLIPYSLAILNKILQIIFLWYTFITSTSSSTVLLILYLQTSTHNKTSYLQE